MSISNSTYYKGQEGEKLVESLIHEIDGYKRTINNIYINDNGKSRQIDHILINQNGIFVIETKNYSGSIYGKETSDKWIKYLGSQKYYFMNPIFQNYAHQKIVSQVIDNEIEVTSVILFTPKCKLNVIAKQAVVLYTDQFAKYLRNQEIKLTNEQIDYYYKTIMDNRITNEEIINNHNSNVQHYIQYKEKLVKEGTCPRCYGKLLVKEGKNGNFLACSNYPRCHFTKEIENVPSINETPVNYNDNYQQELYNYYYTNNYNHNQTKLWTTLLLCILFGYLGIHKFYEGKLWFGIIYLFTFGLLGIGYFVDIIILIYKIIYNKI